MNEQIKQYQQIVAKCWADEAFKQSLVTDPVNTLKAEGVQLPEGMEVSVVENTAKNVHLVIPAQPEVPEGDAVGEEREAAIFLLY